MVRPPSSKSSGQYFPTGIVKAFAIVRWAKTGEHFDETVRGVVRLKEFSFRDIGLKRGGQRRIDRSRMKRDGDRVLVHSPGFNRDISDEHDVVPIGVRPQRDGSYLIAGGVTVRDLNRRFGWDLPDQEAATLAGLVIHEAKVIPNVGQIFHFHGFRFEIMRRQRNRIISIRLSRVDEPHNENKVKQ